MTNDKFQIRETGNHPPPAEETRFFPYSGYWLLVSGIRYLLTAYWLLVTGYFLLVTIMILGQGCGSSGTSNVTGGGSTSFSLTSTAFSNGGSIPIKYAHTGTTGGSNTSLPLSWLNAPAGTNYFAISMIDQQATTWKHWLIINLPSATTSISEGASTSSMPSGSTELTNGWASTGYGGPSPPSGTHTYVITIYALSSQIATLTASSSNAEFNSAVSSNLGSATLSGTFTAP